VKYEISGITVKSNIDFPQLNSVNSRKTDISFFLEYKELDESRVFDFIKNYKLSNGRVWLSIEKYKSSYILRFPNIADFLLSGEKRKIFCNPNNNIPKNTVRHLFINQIIPLYLASKGYFVIHSSAVSINGKGVVFLGKSRAGKSTLASIFCKNGYELITDDFLLIKYKNGLHAVPSYPAIRLSNQTMDFLFNKDPKVFINDDFTDKKWLKADNRLIKYRNKVVPIHRIYILAHKSKQSDKSPVTIKKQSPTDSLTDLLHNCFFIDSSDSKLIENNFNYCALTLKSDIIRKLTYKKEFSVLSEVKDKILKDIRN
jgi:hypothetical protein